MLTEAKSLSFANGIACSKCGQSYALSSIETYAHCCNAPLVVSYDLQTALSKIELASRVNSMWRYAEMLPVEDEHNIVSLGEGMTPMLRLSNLANRYGYSNIFLKDESLNPTGSFKARGISMAISKAKEFGITRCIVPTAGNAGGALAAYCAKAGMDCVVVMPRHTPVMFKNECELYGAELVLVDGLINDCAHKVAALNSDNKYFDVSTLKEPYRLEGKKTMGYEIAEQFNWQLPDVIIYPAGGGTGLIGIWKAFKEMKAMGWIAGALPRMIAVQSQECAPILHALKDPHNWKDNFTPKSTLANGLAVPYPFGMNMMLQVLKESGGTAIAISEEDIVESVHEIARTEGILIAPEGAATWKALHKLRQEKIIEAAENVLLLNTGSGYKYMENLGLTYR